MRRALAAALILLAAPARASFKPSDIGTAGGQFLKLGAGARAEGLGEAYTSAVDDADAIYWNPAALTRIPKHSLTLMEAPLLAGINYQYGGYGQRLFKNAAAGASVQYVSQPGIDETDTNGFTTGSTFHPSDMAAAVGGAYRFEKEDLGILTGAALGASVKYVNSRITKTASTYAADLGFLSRPIPLWGGQGRVSYVVQNLGGQLKFQRLDEQLPLNLMLGGSWSNENWLLAMNLNEPIDNTLYVAFGTEYRMRLNEDVSFAGRLGIITRDFGQTGGFNGLNIGLGARFRGLGLDYAFVPMGPLGLTHYISLGFAF